MDSRAITAWMTAAMLLSQASIGLFGVSRCILRKPHIVLGLTLLPLTFAHACSMLFPDGLVWSHFMGFLNSQNTSIMQDLADSLNDADDLVKAGVPDGI